ncbi:hypothetical protein D3C78_455950 [compost metagenome]
MVTDADDDVMGVPVQAHFKVIGAGIGGIVQQVQQRLGQVRRRGQARHLAVAQALEAVAGFRAHQVPTVERLVQPGRHVLLHHGQAAVGFGGAYQLLQGFLAQLHLVLKDLQVFLQQRVGVVLAHFIQQHAHGRQRRAQLMGGTGGLGGHGQQLLVAQAFFTPLGTQLLLAAQLFGHARGKEGDHCGGQGNAQPHAIDLHLVPRHRQAFERVELHQQQAVGRQRNARQDQRIQPRQGHRSDRQRHQVIRHERVGRAAGVIQQGTVDQQVAGQLQGILQLGDRQRQAQAQRREGAQQRRQGQGASQRQPGQGQQFGPVGDAHGAGLGSQDQDPNDGQAPEVLASSGQRLYGGEHELS